MLNTNRGMHQAPNHEWRLAQPRVASRATTSGVSRNHEWRLDG
jgi:hypothetical protein